MDAPLARALMRKALDDEVTVELPGGERTLRSSSPSVTKRAAA